MEVIGSDYKIKAYENKWHCHLYFMPQNSDEKKKKISRKMSNDSGKMSALMYPHKTIYYSKWTITIQKKRVIKTTENVKPQNLLYNNLDLFHASTVASSYRCSTTYKNCVIKFLQVKNIKRSKNKIGKSNACACKKIKENTTFAAVLIFIAIMKMYNHTDVD